MTLPIYKNRTRIHRETVVFFQGQNECSFNRFLVITFLRFDRICSSDIRAKEKIVPYNTATGIAILHLLIVAKNGRLQRTADR